MFIGKTNGSSYRKSRPKPLIQPHSSTRATPCANAMRKANHNLSNTINPGSVRLVSVLSIDRVDGVEICFGLLRGVQIYKTDEVRIKTSEVEATRGRKPISP